MHMKSSPSRRVVAINTSNLQVDVITMTKKMGDMAERQGYGITNILY